MVCVPNGFRQSARLTLNYSFGAAIVSALLQHTPAPHPYFTKNNVLAWVYSPAVSRYIYAPLPR